MILKKYRKVDKIYILLRCDNCKKEIEIEKSKSGLSKSKFCSEECSELYFNKKRILTKKCKFCKNEYKVSIKEKKRSKFCSMMCFRQYQKYKIQDMTDSIEILQRAGLSSSEIAKRLDKKLSTINNYITYHKLSKGSNRLKAIKNKKNAFSADELLILQEHIYNYKKGTDIDYLANKLLRSKRQIASKLYSLRKKHT